MGQVTARGWSILALGVAVIVLCVVQLGKYIAFRRRAQRVPGTVAGFHKRATGGSGPRSVYQPILEFTTIEGRDMHARMRVGTNPRPARQGQQVTVIYDPSRPTEAEIEGKGWIRVVILLAAAAGGVIIVAAFLVGTLS